MTWSGIKALHSIGLDTTELIRMGAIPIKNFVYMKNNNCKVHHYHLEEYGLGLTRQLLDQWLLEYAMLAGVKVKFGVRANRIVIRDSILNVCGISASHIIIASGAIGMVPLGINSVLAQQSFGISVQITGKTMISSNSVYFYIFGENNLDYFWIIPNGIQLWNIGIWFQHFPKDAIEQFWKYKKKFVDNIFEDVVFSRPLRGTFCGNVDLSEQFPSGCYTIGDAAGLNQITTGEGLRYAITSAIDTANKILSWY